MKIVRVGLVKKVLLCNNKSPVVVHVGVVLGMDTMIHGKYGPINLDCTNKIYDEDIDMVLFCGVKVHENT